MNVSATFIRRSVATSLIAIALLALGVVAFFRLPVSALPQVDSPTVQVNANLPGASPETMASNVATPLERQFSLIPGLEQMTSNSSLGSTSVTLQFELDKDIDNAMQEVLAAVNAAAGQLPNNLPSPPRISKVNPADGNVFVIAMSSQTMPLSQVSDYADNIVGQQLSQIPGVGQVSIGGARKPAMRIRVDPRKAAALGIQIDAIRSQIVASTVNAPKGQLISPTRTYTIYANDQVLEPETWNQMIVGYRNGAPVRLRDLGGAVLSVENTQTGAWSTPGKAWKGSDTLKDARAIHVLIARQPGANIIETVEAIKERLPEIQRSAPPGIDFNVIADRTLTIRASVHDVEFTLVHHGLPGGVGDLPVPAERGARP